MGRTSTHNGWKHIDRLFDGGSLVGLTDRQLLERFVAGETAEPAFEALVDRHGPMVRAVCRSMVGDRDEADDAFQATFLVLARRAGSIRTGDAVGSWLYGVACRVAARTRADSVRRRTLERFLAERARLESTAVEPASEPMPELLEEVERLPERYRAPIVLCYLEGRSYEQAAQALGCPLRTVHTRLQRGKVKLRDRLVRRGLAPGAGFLAMGVESAEAATAVVSGSVPAALSESTARAAVQFAASRAAGLASTAIGLAQGVLNSLFWSRLRGAAGMVAVMIMGVALLYCAWPAAGQKSEKPAATITGRILDDQGRPVPGVDVWMPLRWNDKPEATPHATSDARGNYVLAVPETWYRSPIHERPSIVWAHARGRRIGTANAWYALSGKRQSVDLVVGPATDTSFLVIGPDGRPVAGAVVEPDLILAPNNSHMNPPAAMLPAIRSVTDATGRAALPAMARLGFTSVKITAASVGSQTVFLREGMGGDVNRGAGPLPTPTAEEEANRLRKLAAGPGQREIRLRPVGRIEGRIEAGRPEWTRGVKVYLSTTVPTEIFGHDGDRGRGTAEIITGDDGRFVVPAIAEGKLEASAHPDPSSPVRPRPTGEFEVRGNQTTKFTIFLQKAVRIRGSIRVKDTGEPVAGASIGVSYGSDDANPQGKRGPAGSTTVVSDAKGRFETYGLPGGAGMGVSALPEPFLMPAGPVGDRKYHVPDDATTVELPPIEVAKGIAITGRLVDGDDRPIAGAQVHAGDGLNFHAFATTDERGDFTMSSVLTGVKLSYEVTVTRQDPPINAEIVKEDPLLLRVPIKTPKK